MGYMGKGGIKNLYRRQDVMIFKEVYAMEKIHGTSTHISFKDEELHFFSGGIHPHSDFTELFDHDELLEKFKALGHEGIPITVFGEGYGGKQQGMADTYGPDLKFVAFEVNINGQWLEVPKAHNVCDKLGLEFVHYEKGPASMAWVDSQRDKHSTQAIRNGMGEGKMSEGVILRPTIELRLKDGRRLMAKHKHPDFRETRTKRSMDPEAYAKRIKGREIAQEWVVPMRLTHVLDDMFSHGVLDKALGLRMEDTGKVIKHMIDDIKKEAGDEIDWNKKVEQAVGRETALLYKHRVQEMGLQECSG